MHIIKIIFALSVLFASWPHQAIGADIVVIAHRDYPSDALSLQDLKKIYLGEKQYEGSLKISPIDQRDMNPIKPIFVKKVLDTELKKYKGYWLIRVFKEGIIPPAIKGSSEGIVETILTKRGSVGYVWASEARGKDVKILLTIPIKD